MKPPSDLDALTEAVCDEQTFIAFVEGLSADFALEQEQEAENPSSSYGPGRLSWENGTVDAFLSRAAAWGRAKSLTGPMNAKPNTWQRCAYILYAGKFYE